MDIPVILWFMSRIIHDLYPHVSLVITINSITYSQETTVSGSGRSSEVEVVVTSPGSRVWGWGGTEWDWGKTEYLANKNYKTKFNFLGYTEKFYCTKLCRLMP